MPTNLLALKETTEIMNDYQPLYRSILALFLKNSQAHSKKVGKVNYRRLEAVGDLRSQKILPKDTEIKQITVADGSKVFKKYFLGSQFRYSTLQDEEEIESVDAQILDEHQKQGDELAFFGDTEDGGTTIQNNGLFYSNDPNYTLETSAQIAKGTAGDHLRDMYSKIIATAAKADLVSGEKVLVLYGADVIGKYDSLFATSDNSFREKLAGGLASDVTVVKMPAAITPAGVNGWIMVNLDQIKVNYTVLPELEDQGVNAEMKYIWKNFLMGSIMVDVKTKNAIIRQPVTLEP